MASGCRRCVHSVAQATTIGAVAKLIQKYRNGKDGERQFKGYYGRWYNAHRRPKQKEISLRTKDEQQARLKLAQLELKEIAGEFDPWSDTAPREGVSVTDAAGLYLKKRTQLVERGDLSHRTVRADRSVLGLLAESLPPGMAIDHVQPYHVTDYLDDSELNSNASYNTYLVRLSGFFSWCEQRGLIQSNPCRGLSQKKTLSSKGAFPFLTRSEFNRLIDTVRLSAQRKGLHEGQVGWVIDVFTFMVYTGLRPGELTHLRWDWISGIGEPVPFIHIKVRQDFVPKWRKERSVPVVGQALQILRHQRERTDAYVFESKRGREGDSLHLNEEYLSKRFLRYRQSAGLSDELTLHSLRHTFASWLAIEGVDLYRIQKLLGHRSIETTQRYSHLMPSNLSGPMERVFAASEADQLLASVFSS